MANNRFQINKGINRSIVFKGLKAQYIGYMAAGLFINLVFYAVLYLCHVNTFITLALTLTLGAVIMLFVYHLNSSYGEHGLGKALAKRKIPKVIKTRSIRLFNVK